MSKVYVVFHGVRWDRGCGNDFPAEYIDSIWDDKDSADERLKDLSNQYIMKQWYEKGHIPEDDYDVYWIDDKFVEYSENDETTYFRYEVQELRTGWVEDNKDLPAYFTTT